MARIRKSKINDKYFEVIPKLDKIVKVPKTEMSDDGLKKVMALARLVRQRSTILEESREIRKKLYNVSTEIHAIESEIADRFMEV